MTAYIFPLKGGKQWKIGNRTIGMWVQTNEIGIVDAALYEDQSDTGWVRFATIKSWGDIASFVTEVSAGGGIGAYTVNVLIPLAQTAINSYMAALPVVTNQTPPSIDSVNAVFSEFVDIIPPQAGQSVPQILVSYMVPSGVAPYPSSINPGPPG